MENQEIAAAAAAAGVGTVLVPCFPCAVTPGGTVRAEGTDAVIFNVSDSEHIRPWLPPNTPELASPSSSSQVPLRKKCRRSLNLKDSEIINILEDSGSDGESKEDFTDQSSVGNEVIMGVDTQAVNFRQLRNAARLLRSCILTDQAGDVSNSEFELDFIRDNPLAALIEDCEDEDDEESERTYGVQVECERMEVEDDQIILEEGSTAAYPVETDFTWSEDFTSFTGQKECYLRVPGPTFSSQDPSEIFSKIWDHEFMETVAKETNKYAWDVICQLSDPDFGKGIPKYFDTWTEVTVEELYRFFSWIILM